VEKHPKKSQGRGGHTKKNDLSDQKDVWYTGWSKCGVRKGGTLEWFPPPNKGQNTNSRVSIKSLGAHEKKDSRQTKGQKQKPP